MVVCTCVWVYEWLYVQVCGFVSIDVLLSVLVCTCVWVCEY